MLFIPQYLELKRDNQHKADRFASSIINIILLATIILLLICALFTKQIVFLFAPGLDSENLLYAANYARLLLPTLVITGISIAIRSILQANSSFIGPAVMGIPNHIVVISYLLFGSMYGVDGLIYATALGTSVQFLVQLPFIKGIRFKYIGLGYHEHKDVLKFIHSIGFILVGSSVNQVNTLIDKALASFTGQGNISILNYANKLNLFVIAVFITSITTVIFPKLAGSKDRDQMNSSVKDYLRIIIIILAPVSLLLIYYSFETVNVLFGRGSFTLQNVIDTARVLGAYSLGIIPFGISEILNRTFYSIGDTRTPMRIGLVSVLVNIVLNIILVKYIGIIGLALATSVATTIYMALSIIIINKKLQIINMDFFRWLIKIFVIVVSVLLVLYATDVVLASYTGLGLLHVVVRVGLSSIIALVVYGILVYRYGGYNGS